MNYYIQGDAAKADQIKAAFSKFVSIQEMAECDFSQEEYLFYTGQEERGTFVYSTWVDGINANIIKTHPDYKELELPIEPKFKVGDWVVGIDDEGDIATEKIVSFSHNKVLLLDTDGCHTEYPKTELNGFHLWAIADAKDGDVLATDNGWACIFKAFDGWTFSSYCFMDSQKWFCEFGSEVHTPDSKINGNIHPATKEQRDLFFKRMKEAGYTWDKKKKELKKIQPHYDIANFHTGMPVLVRPDNDCAWDYSVFSRITDNEYWKFSVCNGVSFTQCIPFNEKTKHLLGTADMPSEEFINW